MPRKVFGPGAHGNIVGEIQRALVAAGFDPKGVDESYGRNTAAAVEAFQRARGLVPTGFVDEDTWQSLMQRPLPGMDERSLELTGAFEGHGYTRTAGNWDGAWLTWGIIGFTMKYGMVQKIILSIAEKFPHLVDDAFGDQAGELLAVMRGSHQRQERWANSISVGVRVAEPWRTGFRWLGEFAEVREEQQRVARQEYYLPALETAKRYGLRSELGAALCFDIHVQNGGIKKAARALIEQAQKRKRPSNERALRRIIANAVANTARKAFRGDVRRRKLAIADGEGVVHGHKFVLENWGLGEEQAPDLA